MAIIGSGDIAKVLNDREGAIFFASGVSNSSETNRSEFDREFSLLMNQDYGSWAKCLFYFSTISIYYKDSPYIRHKKEMEEVIRAIFPNYNIIRIGNIDWGTNPNTFLNALRAKKAKGEPFELFDEYRYMISKEELLLLTDNLPLTGMNEINVFGRMIKPKDLI
jgi:hypothetical protein